MRADRVGLRLQHAPIRWPHRLTPKRAKVVETVGQPAPILDHAVGHAKREQDKATTITGQRHWRSRALPVIPALLMHTTVPHQQDAIRKFAGSSKVMLDHHQSGTASANVPDDGLSHRAHRVLVQFAKKLAKQRPWAVAQAFVPWPPGVVALRRGGGWARSFSQRGPCVDGVVRTGSSLGGERPPRGGATCEGAQHHVVGDRACAPASRCGTYPSHPRAGREASP